MAMLINLALAHKNKSTLYIYENILPQPVKRIFFIKGIQENEQRGAGPIDAYEGIVCIEGQCTVIVKDNKFNKEQAFLLERPEQCLIIEPKEWHVIKDFTKGTVLIVFSDKNYEESLIVTD